MKKLIAFDLDGTLAPSKSTLPGRMARLMNQLLERYQVCVISGGKYELFQRQVLTQITQDAELLGKLHLMPTSGTRYYSYDAANSDWARKSWPNSATKAFTSRKPGTRTVIRN
jgi:phosphomannomutase